MLDLKKFKKIVILTGAGISAESGLSTFRDGEGLWNKFKVHEVATPEAFRRNPQFVWKFYSMRRIEAGKAKPNTAHEALAECASKLYPQNEVHLITQNVDGLHQRVKAAHSLEPICMHGSLHQSRCTHCGSVYFDDHAYFDLAGNYAPQETDLCSVSDKASPQYLHHYRLEYREFLPLSPCCKSPIRPHIVFFGETPLFLEKITQLVSDTNLFVTIGTSGLVYPAADFLKLSKLNGSTTVCINMEMIPQTEYLDHFIEGRATLVVPDFFLVS